MPIPDTKGPATYSPWRLLWLILVVGVLLRSTGVLPLSQKFSDSWSWRQGDVAMIADHFYHNGYHLFYPEINWGGPPAGDQRGYVGTEFPIMPWLAAVLYQLTGEHEWVGRGLSVLAWAISLPALFIYCRRLVDTRLALLTCVFYTLMPLSIYTGRSFMPDMPSLAAALWGLALFDLWLDRRKNLWLVAGVVVAIALAILVKPPSILVGFAMLVRALQKGGWRILLNPRMWVMAIVPMIPTVLWYKHAAWLGHTYFPHHFFGAEGLQHEPFLFYVDHLERMATLGMTPIATLAGMLGMVIALRDRRLWPVYAWVAGWALFFVIAGHGNRHPWYQLPLVPPMALFGAVLLVWLYVHIKPAHFVLAVTSCFSILAAVLVTAYVPMKIDIGRVDTNGKPVMLPLTGGIADYGWDASMPAVKAGEATARLTPPDAVILVANSGDPVVFYYANRYGWLIPRMKETGLWNGMPESYNGGSPTDWITNNALIGEIEQRRREGAQFLVLTSTDAWWLTFYTPLAEHMKRYKVIAQTPDYTIIDLR